jgi:hypothetical protein
MQIKGFRFSDQLEGRKTLNIRADELTVEKMKMGHFRVSLFNVAKLKNTKIDIFGQPTNLTDNSAADSHGALDPSGVSFQGVFDRCSLPSLGVKRISFISAQPVEVSLYSQDLLLTSISASSALFDLKNGGVSFRGNVHVVSGSREIQSGSVIFFPEKNAFEVRGSYRLKNSQDPPISGKGLQCDLFLQALNLGTGHPGASLEQKHDKERWLWQKTSRQNETRPPPMP